MIGKLRLLFWLGIGMLFVPFLGIPNTFKMLLAVAVGIALITISFFLRKRYAAMRSIIRNLEQTVTDSSLASSAPVPVDISTPTL